MYMATVQRAPDPIYTLRGSGSPITCLRFHQESNDCLYSGSQNGAVQKWDMKSHRITSTIDAHSNSSVLWIDFIDTNTMLSYGKDGVGKCWHGAGSEWIQTGEISTSAIGFCPGALLKNQTILALPSQTTSTVDLYDVRSLKKIGDLKQEENKLGMVMSMKANQNFSQLLIGYEDGSIALWDAKKMQVMDIVKFFDETVMCLDYSDLANKGVCGSPGSTITTWQVTLDKLKKGEQINVTNAGFNDVKIRHDQKIVALAGWDHQVRIFGLKRMKPLAVLSYHKDSVQCLEFSKDNILACGSKDKHISLWKIY